MLSTQDFLPPPQACDVCLSPNVVLLSNYELYGASAADFDGKVWHCRACRAGVGTHVGTDFPLGYMADRAVRGWRMRVHAVFDPIWQTGRVTRTKAYKLLGAYLEIEHCHISMLTREQLQKAILFCREYSSAATATLRRREAKRDKKAKERDDRLKQQRRLAEDFDHEQRRRRR